ncbi:hypothetical protein HMPREF1600_02126 [Escherichia coli 907715]|nr:hypothetical protein HMPREF1600_02126 [Escherichia coli 907715]
MCEKQGNLPWNKFEGVVARWRMLLLPDADRFLSCLHGTRP